MPKAVQYVLQVYDQIGSLDELLQMAIIDVVRLDCKGDSTHRVRFFVEVYYNQDIYGRNRQGGFALSLSCSTHHHML